MYIIVDITLTAAIILLAWGVMLWYARKYVWPPKGRHVARRH